MRRVAADLVARPAGWNVAKDTGVLDEIPATYNDIESRIAAQTGLVEVVTHLNRVVCVKG